MSEIGSLSMLPQFYVFLKIIISIFSKCRWAVYLGERPIWSLRPWRLWRPNKTKTCGGLDWFSRDWHCLRKWRCSNPLHHGWWQCLVLGRWRLWKIRSWRLWWLQNSHEGWLFGWPWSCKGKLKSYITSLENSHLWLLCIEIVKSEVSLLNWFLKIHEFKLLSQHFPKEDFLIYLGIHSYVC